MPAFDPFFFLVSLLIGSLINLIIPTCFTRITYLYRVESIITPTDHILVNFVTKYRYIFTDKHQKRGWEYATGP